MKHKIQTLLTQLNHGLVERDATLKTALLTVLAGENLVLIGPPGTGKSLIARRIADSFAHDEGNSYFEYLLTKFSTPEEIFGPLSITELKADRFKRNTVGYLPTVKIAFLDEIFKASSSILNALLTILNERVYHNGAEPQKVPMQALIAASNELPNDQEELNALYDRFLVRGFVDYVSQDKLPLLFAKEETAPALTKLTTVDLKNIETAVKFVAISPEIIQAVQRIWIQHKETFKEDRRESLSDRRLKKVIKLLCVSAATNGRTDVDLSDVFLLKDCLWNHQDNALKVREIIKKILQSCSRPVPQNQDLVLPAINNELPTYEVAQDGITLIQAQPQTTVFSTSSALVQASVKLGAVVKGFKGSGTEQDPLLIQTVEDLMDLSRPEVGLQGYYFRQTADIDCSTLSHWMNIPFKGHYHGDGHTIKHKIRTTLFNIIQEDSSITNINLENLWLTSNAKNSYITHCSTNCGITTETANNCSIICCESTAALINGTATNCTITSCKSNSLLIRDDSINCTIADCLVILNYTGTSGEGRGGIARRSTENGIIKRCFVTGDYKQSGGYSNFSGIVLTNEASIIQCALGKFNYSSNVLMLARIAPSTNNTSFLEKNASIHSNPGTDDINGKDGKTVAAELFNKQRFFEHTLNWDFDNVWQWDDKEDRPALRSVGVGATSQQAQPAAQQPNMVDLLTQQISANIWL